MAASPFPRRGHRRSEPPAPLAAHEETGPEAGRMPEPADRRAAERYPVHADVTCPLLAPVVEVFAGARIKDVSMQGVGLIVGRRVEAGALLTVVLSNPARNFTKATLVRVVHATPRP